MKKSLVILTLIFLLSILVTSAYSYPSGNEWPPVFENWWGEWYDKPWGLSRNTWYDEDGYYADLAYESLGDFAELAYDLGQDLRDNYADRLVRAEAVLSFVQDYTEYGFDEDNVFMEGESQVEWAWNADEMAHMIMEARQHRTVAIGDCEDFAFLCSILYLAAGFDVAVVSAPGHAALLIWLPEYPDANIYWDILDGRGYGWIWVEATGDDNPLGWTPEAFSDGYFDTYVIESEVSNTIQIGNIKYLPVNPTSQDEILVTAHVESNDVDIVGVNLVYSVESVIQSIIPMSPVNHELYEATLPRQEGGIEVEFYVQAIDAKGNEVESATVMFKVSDTLVLPYVFFLLVACVVGYTLVLVLLIKLKRKS